MSAQEEILADLKRQFVFVRCHCGLVYKIMLRCAGSDTAGIRCPDCSSPLSSATPTDVRFGVPTAMPRPVSTRKPTARPTILLDMDGVCVQFMAAAVKVQGLDPVEILANWPKGKWDVAEVCGIDKPTFWRKVEEASPEFWINLREYDYFRGMYDQLRQWGDVFFVTSPAWCAAAAQGKIIWLQDRFGKPFCNYVITNQKYLLARSETILIDDFEKNCDAFTASEGRAVLFPRPWNHGHEGSWVAVLEAVQHQVMSIMKG